MKSIKLSKLLGSKSKWKYAILLKKEFDKEKIKYSKKAALSYSN